MERNSENKTEQSERIPKEGDVEVATGAFIVRNGKIFLATGQKFHDKWTVPGGHVNFGETSKACVEREILEEIGIRAKACELFHTNEVTKQLINGRERHFVFLNWKCEVGAQEPKIDGKEFTKAKWFSMKEALEDPDVMASVKECIKKLVEWNG